MNTPVLFPNIIITTSREIAEEFSNPEKAYTSFSSFFASVEQTIYSDQFIVLRSDSDSILNFQFEIQGNQINSTPPKCIIEFMLKDKSFTIDLISKAMKPVKNSTGKLENAKPYFYIAFGVGDDLSYWSNFHLYELLGSKIFSKFDQPTTIQLNLAPQLSVNEAFSMFIKDTLVDTRILESIEFNNKKHKGFLLGKNSLLEKAEVKNARSDFDKNSNLISKYILGFNSVDALIKQTINSLLRALFNQTANVFFISKDIKSEIIRRGLKSGSISPSLGIKTFDLIIKNWTFPATTTIGSPLYAEQISEDTREKYNNAVAGRNYLLSQIKNIFNITLTEGNYTNNNDNLELFAELAVRRDVSEDSDFEARRQKIYDQSLKAIKTGMDDLFSTSKTILVRESDSVIIKNFYSLFSNSSKNIIPLSQELPILLVGDAELINSLLYGIETSVDIKNDKTLSYMMDSWKNKNLYGSQPTKEEVSNLEKALQKIIPTKKSTDSILGFENFPMFRYNVSNPNVLSLEAEDNSAFLSFIRAGIAVPAEYNATYSVNLEKEVFSLLLGKKIQFDSGEAKPAGPLRDELYNYLIKTYQKVTEPQESKQQRSPFTIPDSLPEVLDTFAESPFQEDTKELEKRLERLTGKKYEKIREILINLLKQDKLLELFSFIRTLGISNEFTANQQAQKDSEGNFIISIEDLVIPPKGQEKNVFAVANSSETIKTSIDSFLTQSYSINPLDIEKYRFFLLALLELLLDDSDFPKLETNSTTENLEITLKTFGDDLDRANLFAELFNTLDTVPFTVELKTLPFFSISNSFWLRFPCILLANRPKLIGNNYDNIFDEYLSGSYRIIGIRHDISEDRCESSFVIEKIARSVGNIR